jgi:hypothetical protein
VEHGVSGKGGKVDKGRSIEESKDDNQLMQRKDSGETFKTETMTLKESRGFDDDEQARIDYRRLRENKIWGCTGETDQSTSLLRIKPWEAYRAQENDAKGLLAALSQEDLDRVSSIYFTQEQLKEESEMESETNENVDGPFEVRERRESDTTGVLRNIR